MPGGPGGPGRGARAEGQGGPGWARGRHEGPGGARGAQGGPGGDEGARGPGKNLRAQKLGASRWRCLGPWNLPAVGPWARGGQGGG